MINKLSVLLTVSFLSLSFVSAEYEYYRTLLDLNDTDGGVVQGSELGSQYGPHGVVVAPDGNVWVNINQGTGRMEILANGDTIMYKPIYVLDPTTGDHVSFSPIEMLTFPDGSVDTLHAGSETSGSGVGITLSADGHILSSHFSTLYKINYMTGEGVAMWVGPDGGALTEAAVDDNGNVLVTTVGGGGRSLEVDPNGIIVWEGNYNLSLPNGAVYRAHRIPGLFPTSFSVIVNDLLDTYNGPGINLNSETISFDIVNEGDYELEIHFSIFDQLGWLESTDGNLVLSPNSSETISFNIFPNEANAMSTIELTVTPVHHPDKQKVIQIDGYSNLLEVSSDALPELLQFDEPFPNPFNPITRFRFTIPPGNVDNIYLQLFDLKGRLVETLIHDNIQRGENELVWDAENHSSGIYLVRLHYGDSYITKKIILMQ